MSDSDEETAMWPGSPYALVDTRLCPSCFQPLTATTCAHCGLVVADPRAVATARARATDRGARGRATAAHRGDPARPSARARAGCRSRPPLVRRRARGGPLRRQPQTPPTAKPATVEPPAWLGTRHRQTSSARCRDGAPRARPSRRLGPTRVLAVDLRRPLVVVERAGTSPPATRRRRPRHPSSSPKPPRRRLTVPVLLLIVGVSLVGVAAIFFLVLAWNVAGHPDAGADHRRRHARDDGRRRRCCDGGRSRPPPRRSALSA